MGEEVSGTRFRRESFAPIAASDRSGLDESLFHGAGVIRRPDGSRHASIGDPAIAVYARSTLKPLQAGAMLKHGLDLPSDLLAIACASHNGETEHLAAVRRLLAAYDLSEDDLQNTPSHPLSAAARRAAVAAGVPPSPLQMNCSGKHAAMLATCRVNGWPTENYLDPEHPLQVAIVSYLVALGVRVDHVGVDGCGAPTCVIALDDLAAAYATLVGSPVYEAMTSWPRLVGGADRDVTTWMVTVPGLLAKEGAAAVMALVLPDGTAGAYKVADGSDTIRRVVLPMALRCAGVDVDAHPDQLDSVAAPVLGHGEPVGEIRPLEWTCSS